MQAARIAEETLIERARDGDVRAYEELVEQHQGTAFRVAWLITRSDPDAEEAAQDGFLKAYRSLDRFHRGAPFRPWLLRIVSNEAHNRRVAAARREQLTLRALRERAARPAPGARTPRRSRTPSAPSWSRRSPGSTSATSL